MFFVYVSVVFLDLGSHQWAQELKGTPQVSSTAPFLKSGPSPVKGIRVSVP